MSKYLGAVAFAALCFFALYVLIAPRPADRVNRLCMPAGWTIKTFSAFGSLVSERGEQVGRAAGEDFYASCRYLTFRVLYEDLYQDLLRQQEALQAAGAAAAGGASAAAEVADASAPAPAASPAEGTE
jgi:hypothetical protein